MNNIIHNNNELVQAINDIIKESGYKKTFISENLGISNQNFNRLMNKKNFSLDDANKILNIIGYNAKIIIENNLKK